MDIKNALLELRKSKERKFKQSIDLIISLRGLDMRKDNINAIVTIPHPFKEKRVCGFLTKKNDLVRTILQLDFQKYKDKDLMKKLVKDYDFFIAHASLMPQVATNFGKSLGPTGKMPSPQLGVLIKEDDVTIKALLEKINQSVKIRLKEPCFKVSIGKEDMSDEQIKENILAVYNGLVNVLPVKGDNVKYSMLKLTMSKPIKVEIK
jgi:large subunit ribosomal protein L1